MMTTAVFFGVGDAKMKEPAQLCSKEQHRGVNMKVPKNCKTKFQLARRR